ncbi:MAG: TldD/PmbA family protein [Myxococcales bacterium]|nr:TldD/PmbA family protein [Myxococcales bacterium]
MADLLQGAQRAVEFATKAGAAGCFAHIYQARSVSCQVRDGKLEKMEESTQSGISVELYVDGRYSSHSTNDLRPEVLQAFIADAVALTRVLEVDEHRQLPDPARYAKSIADLDLHDPAIAATSADDRLQRALALNERVAGKDKVISASSAVSESEVEIGAVSSNGFAGTYRATDTGLYADATLRDEGDKRPEGGFGMSARHLADLMSPEAVGDEALRQAIQRLGSQKGPTVRTTMVVDRHSAGSLLMRLLMPAYGWAVQQGRSMWTDKLDKRLLSKKLSIVSDPLIPRGQGSRPFDGEGLASFRMPVIEAGALKNYALDTYYARKLGMEPTTGSPGNLVVSPGKRDLDRLIAGVGEGVFVTSWLGGNADSTTGDFSFGLRGHMIRKGAIAEPVGEMNVTGNLIELFAKLGEIGGDPWLHGRIRTPSLVFTDVQFSGA